MIDLNDLEQIKKLDPKDVFGSTGLFTKQCEQIWNDAKLFSAPPDYPRAQNIIICGMGGSAYGGHVALSAFSDKLKIPLVVNNNYSLPNFANENSLVVLVSYSGSTEETLSCAKAALEKNCKVVALTSGGKLAEFAKENSIPSLIFSTTNNPSGQPRLGTGYVVLGTLALLNRIGIISIINEDVEKAISETNENANSINNSAKEMAKNLESFTPLIFSGDFLEGNSHIMRNQFNETAKSFSSFHVIPELNHHLMEGLKNPKNNKLKVLFLDSDLYPDIIKKRFELTKDVVSKNDVSFIRYKIKGTSRISQVFEVLSLGGYLTLYLALIYGQDPSLIPWVDYFKKQLAAK